MNDVAKLPRWARDRIRKLEDDIEHYRSVNAVVSAGESDTWIETHTPDFGTKTFLPSGSLIKFKTKSGIIRCNVMRDTRDSHVGKLDVNSENGTMILEPRAGNVVYIHSER